MVIHITYFAVPRFEELKCQFIMCILLYVYVIGESSMHHFKPKRKRGNPDNYCTHFAYIHTYVFTYVHTYYMSSCTVGVKQSLRTHTIIVVRL